MQTKLTIKTVTVSSRLGIKKATFRPLNYNKIIKNFDNRYYLLS